MSGALIPSDPAVTAEAPAKPIIAIDIDDVLSSSAQAFVNFSNERWGTRLSVDDYDEDWARMWNLDRSNEDHLEIIRTRGNEALESSVPHMDHAPDAYEVLKVLKNDYTLIVVTSRRTQLKTDTLAWIKAHYTGIFEDDAIYFTGFYDNLHAESWRNTKGDILRDLNVSYLIDDQIKHCNSAAEHGIQALQFGGYGPQLNEPMHGSVVRVKNWNEVGKYFDAKRERI